ncbi:manganese catalase [Priestia filamentosa]|uniref:Manganese catalase n=1 Tax=Priestia filamentosa TaxID=1402861 RepID=A0A1X7EC33_9BACI|nr:manganese catalase family protein [Priestia filamentosa]AKO92760.1 manganese catalase [Priestia filamentosa]MDT3762790.1 manganese catalase family protein [Priestia filamentosa]OXS69325.1 manganese catalase [Priestia filamentosa]RJS63960.1 manganese catalase [Priestia filamentosa]WCM13889.1 manganese catalase family protein [Priestia filamentosa]
MFRHQKELQFEVKVDKPDPMLAKQVQEVLGGQFGEMTVMMQYLFQGFNCRGNEKYKDMLMDIGTEEIGHVEMLCSLISQLLDGASPEDQAEAAKDPATAAIMGGINPQHLLVSGLGGLPSNSQGVPWNGNYIVASGNLLADMRSNLHAESQGRLQVARLYHMTKDEGVRKVFRKMLARDRYHQYQWMEAINELEEKNGVVVPSSFPPEAEKEAQEEAYKFWDLSEGTASKEGPWAQGTAPDGTGKYVHVENPQPQGQVPNPNIPDPALHHDLTKEKVSSK